MTLFLQKGWITRAPGYREVQVTDSGKAALSRLFNLKAADSLEFSYSTFSPNGPGLSRSGHQYDAWRAIRFHASSYGKWISPLS